MAANPARTMHQQGVEEDTTGEEEGKLVLMPLNSFRKHCISYLLQSKHIRSADTDANRTDTGGGGGGGSSYGGGCDPGTYFTSPGFTGAKTGNTSSGGSSQVSRSTDILWSLGAQYS